MPVVTTAPAGHVPGQAEVAADLEGVVTLATATGEDVLVVAPDEQGAATARAARLVLGAHRVGLVRHEVPPTAFFLAVTALRALPAHALGLAPAVLGALARQTRTAAVLSSVTGLRSPRPTWGQDLASRFPGRPFTVDWDAATVARGTLPGLPDGVAVVTSSSARPVVPEDLLPPTGAAQVPLETDGSFWGARRWFEATVLLTSLDAIVRDEVRAPSGACPSCGRPAAGTRCLFCEVPLAAGPTNPPPGGHA